MVIRKKTTQPKKVIMKLENQVCTLENAKKLSEIGIIQGASLFFYNKDGSIQYNSHRSTGHYKDAEHCFSAFTVAELAVMLGDDCSYSFDENKVNAQFSKSEKPHWIAAYTIGAFNGKEQWLEFGDTMAEACARLLILLIEKGKRNPEECNKRLAA